MLGRCEQTFEIPMLFWGVTPFGLAVPTFRGNILSPSSRLQSVDRASTMFLRKACVYLQVHTKPLPSRSTPSLQWEPQISDITFVVNRQHEISSKYTQYFRRPNEHGDTASLLVITILHFLEGRLARLQHTQDCRLHGCCKEVSIREIHEHARGILLFCFLIHDLQQWLLTADCLRALRFPYIDMSR
jgi:hypothetical protein